MFDSFDEIMYFWLIVLLWWAIVIIQVTVLAGHSTHVCGSLGW